MGRANLVDTLRPTMTLERLTERLAEERQKEGKVDGRRFNTRSKTKMTWEMRNINKSIATNRRRKKNGTKRSMYTKEELQEYKEIEDKFREDQKLKQAKENNADSEVSKTPSQTPPGTPPARLASTPTSPESRRKYTA